MSRSFSKSEKPIAIPPSLDVVTIVASASPSRAGHAGSAHNNTAGAPSVVELTIAGQRIRVYERSGLGPDVLVVPGWGEWIDVMQPLLLSLTGCHLLTFDPPGFGRSGPLRSETSIEAQWEEVVRGVVDRFATGPVLLVGRGLLGGRVALRARRGDARVARVIAIGALLGGHVSPTLRGLFSASLSAALLAWLRGKDEYDRRRLIERCRPALNRRGEHDAVAAHAFATPLGNEAALRRLAADSRRLLSELRHARKIELDSADLLVFGSKGWVPVVRMKRYLKRRERTPLIIRGAGQIPRPELIAELVAWAAERVVEIRPLGPEDESALNELIANLDLTSVWQRFHTGGRQRADHLLSANRPNRFAIGAFFGQRLVGHGVLSQAGDTADFGVVVAGDKRRRGIGRALLRALVTEARTRRVRSIVFTIKSSNEAMIRLLEPYWDPPADWYVERPGLEELDGAISIDQIADGDE